VDLDELTTFAASRSNTIGHPMIVGISGYGGSGKSTLARALTGRLSDAVRIRGDDFLDPTRSHRRSADWDGVERLRLHDEVLAPYRERRPSSFRRWDWAAKALGAPEPVPVCSIIAVDLIGLFHPSVLDAFDLTIWCDVDLDTAHERGMRRDAELGRDHARLWNEVWVPNERDFDEQFFPREHAEILFPTG
jgi:uridine kinase